MTKRNTKHKCSYCGDFFTPDYRNRPRQRFCSKPECRKASKAASQKRWLNKPENRNYFRGAVHVGRTQAWRKAHPGYSRRNKEPLQDHLSRKGLVNPEVMPTLVHASPAFAP